MSDFELLYLILVIIQIVIELTKNDRNAKK